MFNTRDLRSLHRDLCAKVETDCPGVEAPFPDRPECEGAAGVQLCENKRTIGRQGEK